MKADMAESHSALTKAIDDASSQHDAAEKKLKLTEAKLGTLRDSVHRFTSSIFGKSAGVFLSFSDFPILLL